MKYIADLHIHSKYSRATAKNLDLENIYIAAQLKGITLVGTGDFTHPAWFAEIQEKLIPAEPGLFRLKHEIATACDRQIPESCRGEVRFILQCEISNIYKKNGKTRKNHHVLFCPDLETVSRLNAKLESIGNIKSDGRPILGLDARDLLEIALETDDNAQFIPAHVWTPWFSLFGSKSGFDDIHECFEDLTEHIFALETGLSSDPPMNWRWSALDRYNLVSNSDAHSPEKLAREANVFDGDMSYDAIFRALKDKNDTSFWGTIEFFPEEGKYHMDGHRKCGHMSKPADTIANHNLCPVCGKPAVLGVSYRVEELADRSEGYEPQDAKSFASLIPLPEVISEIVGVGPKSKRVQKIYHQMLQDMGDELSILFSHSVSDISAHAGPLMGEAIQRMRNGQVNPIPGYDGEFGVIRIFDPEEKEEILQQGTLFSLGPVTPKSEKKTKTPKVQLPEPHLVQEEKNEYGLNAEQQKAVEHSGSPLIIVAGPGTGKTRTLTQRLATMVEKGRAQPKEILAITFTNKAAREMQSRLNSLIGDQASAMSIQTFHAFGLQFLRDREYFYNRDSDFAIIDPVQDYAFREQLADCCREKISKSLLERISLFKSQGFLPENLPKDIVEKYPLNTLPVFEAYEELLAQNNAVDFEDLVSIPFRLLSQSPELRREMLHRYPVIAVDEFQDINKSQYELFRLLAIAARDVCVIGDPDQAIYGFRGAGVKFFKHFTQDFPQARSIRLVRNYRSAQNIVSASLQMLGRPDEPDQLWSNLSPDVKIKIQQSPTDKAEAEFVVHQIEQLVGGTGFFSMDSNRVQDDASHDLAFGDFAVLLRSRRLVPALTEAFSRSGIPFEQIEDEPLNRRAFVQLLSEVLDYRLHDNHKRIDDMIKYFYPDTQIIQDKKAEQTLPLFTKFRQELVSLPEDFTVTELLDWLMQFVHDDEQDKRDAKRLFELAGLETSGEQFLDMLMLQREIDNLDPRGDRVRMLTCHASKGLEFPVVFVVGCEEGVFPAILPGQKVDLDEERRLLYVAMTRAERFLYLTHAKQRLLFGRKQKQQPSRFLAAISESLVERDKTVQQAKKNKKNQMSLF